MVIIALLLSYFLGSIPFGLLLTRIAGAGDVRAIGSGNIGATNVLRTGKKGLAAATLLLDMAKGYAAVWLAHRLHAEPLALCALAAVLGHVFPVWLKFKGGKGVATAFGAYFALAPLLAAILAGAWLAAFLATRYVSVASMLSLCLAPLAALGENMPFALASAAIAALVVWKHKDNLARLRHGTEHRFTR